MKVAGTGGPAPEALPGMWVDNQLACLEKEPLTTDVGFSREGPTSVGRMHSPGPGQHHVPLGGALLVWEGTFPHHRPTLTLLGSLGPAHRA